MVLGDAVTKLLRFVWIFNHVSRVITWSLFNLRTPNLLKKKNNLNMTFYMVVSVYRLVWIWNSPQFHTQLRNGQSLRATLTRLSCSPNFPRAFITRYTHAKHKQILNCMYNKSYNESWCIKIIFPMKWSFKTSKLSRFLISEGIFFHGTGPL